MAKLRIILDVEMTDDNDKVSVTVTCRPMVPALRLAELLRETADEITGGRLDSLKIRPLSEDE